MKPQMEEILENLPHNVWSADEEGNIIYTNDHTNDYTGQSADDTIGWKWITSIFEEDRDSLLRAWKRCLQTKECYNVKFRMKGKNNGYRWFFNKARFVEKSRIWVGSVIDVHDEVLNESFKNNMETLLNTVVHQLPIAVCIFDTEGKLVVQNKPMQNIWKVDKADKIPSEFKLYAPEFECYHLDGTPYTIEDFPLNRSLLYNEVIRLEEMKIRKGDRNSAFTNIFMSTAPVKVNGNAVYVIGLIEDLNERVELELAKQETKTAISASLMKSEFLANMSHEIRTPIHGMMGMIDLLSQTPPLNSDQMFYIDTMKRSVNTLLVVINDILDFSKIEANKMVLESSPFCLDEILNDLKLSFGKSINDKGIYFIVNVQESVPKVLVGDPHRLKQILTNLISNAIKFTESSGEIRLDIESTISGNHVTDIVFTVSDTGIGMDESTLSKIFKPFVQADQSTTRKYGGTGLGLAITKKLLDLMNDNKEGTLIIHSNVGKGTTVRFSISFPQGEKNCLDNLAHIQPFVIDDLDPTEYNIVIAEDNKIGQIIALKLINKLGYNVHSTNDGQETVNYILDHNKCDLLLLDIQMPIMDGYEAAKALRDAGYDIPIIALTASAMESDKDRCINSGMDDFLSKPYDSDTISRKIRQWIGKKSVLKLSKV